MHYLAFIHRTDNRLKNAEEAASKKLINSTAKQCPGCKRNIEKIEGCDHMTCKWNLYRAKASLTSGQVRNVDMSSAGAVWRHITSFGKEAIAIIARAVYITYAGTRLIS
jgi:hypothetical protein